MNIRQRIVCWVLIMMALFGTTMCRSGGDDATPVPIPTKAETVVGADVDVEAESTATPEQLPAIIAQVETRVPSSSTSTRTVRPTRTPVPIDGSNTSNASEASEDASTDDDEPAPTETRLIIRTEEPTITPETTPENAIATPMRTNVLLLPTPRMYMVREGDTIRSIAHFCEVTVLDLLAENRIDVEDADKIVPGQVLRVPEAN